MNLVEKLIHLDRESPKRIAVVGDRMTDVYVLGRVEDTCQDGCPKFVEERRVVCEGGAANAARSLRDWWSAAVCFGQQYGPVKTRFMANDLLVWRHDAEQCLEDMEQTRREDIDYFAANRFHAALLCDYDKGFLTPEFIQQVAALCRERGVPCVADAKREPGVYAGCVLKCNREYAMKHVSALAGRRGNVIITNGAGCPVTPSSSMPFMDDGSMGCWMIPHVNRDVICKNHIGAGDAFGAHMTLALAHGFSLEDAAAVAHSAGRVYVQRMFNHPPRPEEVARDFAGERAIVDE